MAATVVSAGSFKIIIATPARRLALAIPEQIPLGMTLPALVAVATRRPAGDLDATGWSLRRTDGSAPDLTLTPAAGSLLDGEVLHLVPPNVFWPPPHTRDRLDAGAPQAGAEGRRRRSRAGAAVGAAALLATLIAAVAAQGAPWIVAATALLVLATALVGLGGWFDRAELTGLGLVAAAAGGAGLLAQRLPVAEFTGAQLLTAAAAVGMLSVVAAIAGGTPRWVPTAGLGIGVGAAGTASASMAGLNRSGGAAVLAVTLLIVMPLFPTLAVRLGGVPMPSVPRGVDELLNEDPIPSRAAVASSVDAAVQLLVGAVVATACLTVAAVIGLAATTGVAGRLLAAVTSVAMLLRARLFVAAAQRAPLAIAGALGLAATVLSVAATTAPGNRLLVILPLLVLAAAGATAAGLRYSGRLPSPYLGRVGDVLDVLLAPVACLVAASVLDLYHLVRSLGG